MKKRILLLTFIIITAFTLITVCTITSYSKIALGYTNEIKELNANCNLDFKLAKDEKKLKNKNNFIKIPGWGGYRLESKDRLTSYTISGYPDCLDGYKVTGFQTEDSKYSVYDISVGENVDNAIAKLESKSYKKDVSTELMVYKKGKVTIMITDRESKISRLSIGIFITNKNGIVF
jgi:hypothetical protein